jgi:hypothetical protein
MRRPMALPLLVVTLLLGTASLGPATAAPSGQVVVAWHVTIAPSWFDPSTAPPQIGGPRPSRSGWSASRSSIRWSFASTSRSRGRTS